MITCYNCGKQVSDETLICPECGALVRRYEAPRQTPETDQPLAYLAGPAERGTAGAARAVLFHRRVQGLVLAVHGFFYHLYL